MYVLRSTETTNIILYASILHIFRFKSPENSISQPKKRPHTTVYDVLTMAGVCTWGFELMWTSIQTDWRDKSHSINEQCRGHADVLKTYHKRTFMF